jgi:hypothetical protein
MPPTPPPDFPPVSYQPRKPIRYKPRPAAAPAAPSAAAAVVVSATVGPDGVSVTLVFDRPLALTGPVPYEMDGSVTFGAAFTAGVNPVPPQTLTFDLEGTVEPGQPWAITAQPAWLATPVMVPQNGTLG